MRTPLSFLFFSAVFLFTCQVSRTAELSAADWMVMSQKSSGSPSPVTPPTNFQTIQLLLSQAMAYSAAGDIDKLTETMHRIQVPGAKWMDGGEGMMRQTLVKSEILSIHKIAISALAKKNRFNDALTYCMDLAQEADAEEIFFYLGRQLADKDSIPDKPDSLSQKLYAAMRLGVVSSLIDHSQKKAATVLCKQIETGLQKQIINHMLPILLLNGSMDSFQKLLAFSSEQKILEQNTLLFVLNRLSTSKRVERTVPLLAPFIPPDNEALQASLALSYLSSNRPDLAENIFTGFPDKNLRKWETVAVSLKKDDWLLKYYQSQTNQWRKTERLYQLAKRMLGDGKHDQSLPIAEMAVESAARIPSEQTRATAHSLLAQYFALSGDVSRTREMTELISSSQVRNLAKATAQLAKSQMKSGFPEDAVKTALSINDAGLRGDALLLAAAVADNEKDYSHMVKLAEQNCTAISEKRLREKAWQKLAQMQLQREDYQGIKKTIELALLSGSGSAAAEELIAHYILQQSFDKAFSVARLIPDSFDNSKGYNRQQRSFQTIITAIADAGKGLYAMEEMQRITNKSTWDLTAPAVARALANEGNFDAIASLLNKIQRNDARAKVMSLLLLTQLKNGALPDGNQLAMLPKSYRGRYCWAAAFSQADIQTFTSWVKDLPSENCRSFACAGKAFVLTAPQEFRKPDKLSWMFDPAKMQDQIMNAMYRQRQSR